MKKIDDSYSIFDTNLFDIVGMPNKCLNAKIFDASLHSYINDNYRFLNLLKKKI